MIILETALAIFARLVTSTRSVRDIVVLDDNGTPGNPADDQWIIENHITYRAFGKKAAQTGAAFQKGASVEVRQAVRSVRDPPGKPLTKKRETPEDTRVFDN